MKTLIITRLAFLSFLFSCLALLAAENARVVNLVATPRTPWNGLVDITYSLECDTPDDAMAVSFQGHDRDWDESVPMTSLTGDGAAGELLQAGGPYHIVWDSAADWPGGHSSEFTVTATAEAKENWPRYLVVDLNTGAITTSPAGPDLSDDTCRTTELWLRRIQKGTFTMGSPDTEVGRFSSETQHQVTLTEDFYIGVFPITQKQFFLVYGSNPSNYQGDTRPVEKINYGILRGESKGAGRAGTTTALNTGKNLTWPSQDSAMDEAGRYLSNQKDGRGGYSEHTKVGSYQPNAWGLYDMHGNVRECCLDWYQKDLGNSAVTDPKGPATGTERSDRGGSFFFYAQHCRSATRNKLSPLGSSPFLGGRVALTLTSTP